MDVLSIEATAVMRCADVVGLELPAEINEQIARLESFEEESLGRLGLH